MRWWVGSGQLKWTLCPTLFSISLLLFAADLRTVEFVVRACYILHKHIAGCADWWRVKSNFGRTITPAGFLPPCETDVCGLESTGGPEYRGGSINSGASSVMPTDSPTAPITVEPDGNLTVSGTVCFCHTDQCNHGRKIKHQYFATGDRKSGGSALQASDSHNFVVICVLALVASITLSGTGDLQ